MLASGRIGDQWAQRCNTPTTGTGSPNVFGNMLASTTIGKQTIPYQETVPCPTCCTTHVAPVLEGSKKVFVNCLSYTRIGDKALGISGQFPLFKGSPNVFVL